MSQGWIKLHRQIKDHWIYKSKDPYTKREAFLDILLEVNHSEETFQIKGELFTCFPGQSLNSLETWGKRWRWSTSKVKRFFVLLQKDSIVELKNERKTTRLSLCNWETYQDERKADEKQTKSKRVSNEKQTSTNKNEKNEKNDIITRKSEFKNKIWKTYNKRYSLDTIRDFFEYWSEHGDNDKKMRFEKERTFSLEARIKRWDNNNFNKPKNGFQNKDSKNESNLSLLKEFEEI